MRMIPLDVAPPPIENAWLFLSDPLVIVLLVLVAALLTVIAVAVSLALKIRRTGQMPDPTRAPGVQAPDTDKNEPCSK